MIFRLAALCLFLPILALLAACGAAAPTPTMPPTLTVTATTVPTRTTTPVSLPPLLEPANRLSRRCDQGQSFAASPMVPGQLAIDFTLKDTKGITYTLSSLLAQKPVVLIFGSFSEPLFRQQCAGDDALVKKYGNFVSFMTIYTKEAHPFAQNPAQYSRDSRGTPVTQPATYEQRLALAARMITETKITMPVLLDEIDNPLWCSYGRMTSSAFLIGKDGRIVLRQDQHETARLEREIRQYLGLW